MSLKSATLAAIVLIAGAFLATLYAAAVLSNESSVFSQHFSKEMWPLVGAQGLVEVGLVLFLVTLHRKQGGAT